MSVWSRSTAVMLLTILITSLASMIFATFGFRTGLSATNMPRKTSTLPGKDNAHICVEETYICYLNSHITPYADPHQMYTNWMRNKLGIMNVIPGYKEPVRSNPCATASIVELLDHDTSGLVLEGERTVANCRSISPVRSRKQEASHVKTWRYWEKERCRSWYRVRTPSGKVGWVSASSVGSITGPRNVTDRFRDYTAFTPQDKFVSSPEMLADSLVERMKIDDEDAYTRLSMLVALDEDHAVAILDHGAGGGDSVGGARYAFYLKRHYDIASDKAYWRIDYVTERFLCLRGTSDGNICF